MIDGNIVGGTASSPTWTMNGNEVTPPYTEISVPGGQLFVGGDQPSNDLCASTTFRVAISLRGRLPGVYSYTVNNSDTSLALTRSIIYTVNTIHNAIHHCTYGLNSKHPRECDDPSYHQSSTCYAF